MKKSIFYLLVSILIFSLIATFSFIGCKAETSKEKGEALEKPVESTEAPQKTEEVKKQADGVTTISLVRPGTLDKVYAFLGPAIAEFEAKNPDIKVNVEYMGWTQWIETYAARFSAGEQPDVAWWWDDKINDDVVKDPDLLVPLNDLIDPELKELIPPTYLELTNIDGNILTVPVGLTGLMLFYRKDVFKQAGLDPNRPPQSWDELLEYAEKIKNNTDVAPIAMEGKVGGDTFEGHITQFIYQTLGTGMLDKNNKPIFNTPEVAKTLEFAKKTVDYAQEGWMEYLRPDVRPLFRDGKIAMLLNESSWAIPMLQAKFGQNLDESPIAIAPPISGPAGKFTYVGADGWAILRDDHLEASAKLLNFLISPEQNYRHNLLYGGVPMYASELEKPEFQYDFWKKFVEAVTDYQPIQRMGKYHPAPAGIYAGVEAIYQKYLASADMSSQEALDELEAFINDYNAEHGVK